MARLPTALCFEVEDIVDPQSDDVALWTAQILAECGLAGSFMLVGERVRQWDRRGRRDVIEALKRHHLAYHTTWHSIHPTTTEICLDKDFAQGMDALWEWDRPGWADAERILGRPLLGWARSGSSWAPSLMGLLGRLGRGNAYSYVRLPGHNVCWYANCLGFFSDGIGGFDGTYYDDELFERRLAEARQELDDFLRDPRRGAAWLCFFMCHPTRVTHTEFWDAGNFAAGANPPPSQWKAAPRHDPSRIPVMQKNYRRLCEFLRGDSRLEIVGWGELLRRYDGQRAFASQTEVREIAQRIADERRVLFTDHFTAGEILLLLCRAATDPHERYPRPTVYGPLTTPPPAAASQWDAAAVRDAAHAVLRAAEGGYLPAAVEVGGQPIGIGTYFVALAEAILGRDRVSGPADAPYPPEAEGVARDVARALPDWIIHPPGMDLTLLLEQTRLQCWTLKPAWTRDAL